MHIVPLVVGDERAAMALCQQAIELGVFAQAIRPPTVPAGTSRLRLTTMASHTPGELRVAAQTLSRAARKIGVEPAEVLAPAPDPLEEIQEIETALVRAERLAASSGPEPGSDGSGPFDFEREAVRGTGAAPRRAAGPEAAERWEAAPESFEPSVVAAATEDPGAPTELFDFEQDAVRAA